MELGQDFPGHFKAQCMLCRRVFYGESGPATSEDVANTLWEGLKNQT